MIFTSNRNIENCPVWDQCWFLGSIPGAICVTSTLTFYRKKFSKTLISPKMKQTITHLPS